MQRACGPNGGPPSPPRVPQGAVPGGVHEEFCKCPACGTTLRLKSNRAAVEERERMRRLCATDPCAPACRTAGCATQASRSRTIRISTSALARRRAATRAGDARAAQRSSRPANRLGDTSGPTRTASCSTCSATIFPCEDVEDLASPTATSTGISTSTTTGSGASWCAGKDFSRGRLRQGGLPLRHGQPGADGELAQPEAPLAGGVPTSLHRALRPGFTMEASFQFDPEISPAEAEAWSLASNEDQVSTAFRRAMPASGRKPSSTPILFASRRLRA